MATGLVDANTRMYDPSMGRFTTMDSVFGDLANPVSLNQYVYGNNNPVTMSDPSGMSAMSQYRAALREYSALLVAWRASLAAYNFYLNVALPDYADRLESWNNLRPDMQAAAAMPTPPPFVPPPGPKPTPPALPPITVTSRAHIQEARSNILEAAREAAAVAADKARADGAAAMEQRHAAQHEATRQGFAAQAAAQQAAADAMDTIDKGGGFVHRVDLALEFVVYRPASWALGQVAGHVGRADGRSCGDARCYDNANFLVPAGKKAITIDRTIFCRDVCDSAMVTHELVHVEEVERTGISFVPRYFYHLAVNGSYCDNPWEKPAYQTSGECT